MENGGEKIIKINIEEEMKSSYIDYSIETCSEKDSLCYG